MGSLRLASAVFGFSVLFAGCGQSPCARTAQVNAALVEKAKACRDVDVTPAADAATCEQSLSRCSGAELERLEQANRCLEQLPVCEAGESQRWVDKLDPCVRPLGALTDACRQAL